MINYFNMKSAKYFLTIGIPTWNRSKFLERLLDSLIFEIEKNKINSIEILISDNASDDNTEFLMRSKYLKKYDYVKYLRNFKNIKLKGNILNVVKKSSGKYIWLMGDDDLIIKGKLIEIINLIKNNNNKILLLNSININGGNKFYGGLPEGEYYFNLYDALMNQVITSMGLISNLILPSYESKKVLKHFKKFNSIWPHLHIAFLVSLNQNFNFLLYNYAITNNNNNNNLIYQDVDDLKIYIEGNYDLIKTVESQLKIKLGRLKFVNITFIRMVLSYISSTFSGNYFKNIMYVVGLNIKIKNFKLIFFSIPFLLPLMFRRLFFYFICLCTHNLELYNRHKNIHLISHLKCKNVRAVTSKENF